MGDSVLDGSLLQLNLPSILAEGFKLVTDPNEVLVDSGEADGPGFFL